MSARPARRALALTAAAVALCAGASWLTASEETPTTAGPQPEILFLDPASGSTVAHNPFELRGRNAGTPIPRGLALRASTFVGALRFDPTHRFRIPVYLEVDETGRTIPLQLRLPDRKGLGRVVATTDLDLPNLVAIDEVETRLAELDEALAAQPASAAARLGLPLVDNLRDSGLPLFASLALDRLELALTPDADGTDPLAPELRARLLAARLELAVILGHVEALAPASAALDALLAASMQPSQRGRAPVSNLPEALLVSLAERLYQAAALALVQGFERDTALALHALANEVHRTAGRLPRKPPREY